MQSCIYEGRIHHRRTRPVHHQFGYSLYLLSLDLDELETVFRNRWLWSTRRSALARFRRDDHLGDASIPLKTAVCDLVEEETGQRPSGPIRLLTNLRYFGYAMNPLCLYYCFDSMGEQVETIVAEVNNTPWGEQHCYVLQRDSTAEGSSFSAHHPKAFHVSPFMDMAQHYQWELSHPGEGLNVHISSFEQGTKLFDATMTLERRPITTGQLARVLIRYPFVTGQVVAAIYWQALRLWWKQCPSYPHPSPSQQSKVPAS